MKNRSPKFLYFDLGRVLLNFDHEIALRRLAQLGEVSVDRIREVVFGTALQSDYERGAISTSEFCNLFREQTGLTADDKAICHAASDIFSMNEPVVSMLHALHRSGWPVGLLSNTCDAHWTWIRNSQHEFLELLNPLVLSFEVGAAKPDAKIYADAARMAEHDPPDIFFVDDLTRNVEGAQRAGFDAVLYTSAEQLELDLKVRGVTL